MTLDEFIANHEDEMAGVMITGLTANELPAKDQGARALRIPAKARVFLQKLWTAAQPQQAANGQPKPPQPPALTRRGT